MKSFRSFSYRFLEYLFAGAILVFVSINALGQSYFHDVSDSLGIQTSCGSNDYGSGVSFCDFDDDGWADISLGTESGRDLYFFKNMIGSGGGFQLIPMSGVSNTTETRQVLWVDYDNDNDKDLFITGFEAPNRLYQNDGLMSFTDVTLSSGLPIANTPSFGANFGDVNNDGWLDLLVVNRSVPVPGSYFNELYLNDGNGGFIDITQSAGLVNDSTLMLCAAFFDIENDLDQDIYMANDKYMGNRLYENQGGGTYNDASLSSGAYMNMDAMNVGIGDYDNDGFLDIYVTNSLNPLNPNNKLLKNNGGASFTEVASLVGVEFGVFSWGANWLDVDNDMDLDLYCSGIWNGTRGPSACFENIGNGIFQTLNSMGFIGDTTSSYSNAIGDFNNDGFSDIAVNNTWPDSMQLWMNNGTSDHWLRVSLEGTTSNKDGIGSFIEVYIDGEKYIRYTHCGIAYLAQNSFVENFGLGTNTVVDSVKVRWLSGIVDVLYNINADQKIHIVEGSMAVKLSAKVFLEGPYDDGSGLMIDSLRIANYLPVQEPFTVLGFGHNIGGLETAGPSVFDVTGSNAIVDWVYLELRDKNDYTNIVHTRSALVQRDGDVVERDGISPVVFSIPSDDYYVAIRHRNHLGVMGNTTVSLSSNTTIMDFTDGSVTTYGTDAQKHINGTLCLWSGNVVADDRVKYAGLNNDRDPILVAIGGVVPTASITGYHVEDTSLDGIVRYTGSDNDRDIILVNIGGVVTTASRIEQLP